MTTSSPAFGTSIAGFALAILCLLSACGDGATSEADRFVPAATPDAIGRGGEQLTLQVVDAASGLSLITDHRGFVVYGIDGETTDNLVCTTDECTSVWTPLPPRDMAISNRLNPTTLQVFERPGGSQQVAYLGVPLYLWTGDDQVGLAGGAGVAGVWFALSAAGAQVR